MTFCCVSDMNLFDYQGRQYTLEHQMSIAVDSHLANTPVERRVGVLNALELSQGERIELGFSLLRIDLSSKCC